MEWKNIMRITRYGVPILAVLAGFTWYTLATFPGAGTLSVSFLNVGQGDAIFIESPTGTQTLIDGGPHGEVLRELRRVMPLYDRSIDMLVISNPDADHIGGFADILARYNVGTLLEPGTGSETATFKAVKERAERERGMSIIKAQRGMIIDLGGGAYFEILFPDRDVRGLSPNDGSLVGKLVHGKTTFLFPGDAPERIENYVVFLDGERLAASVLKVGHHGSRTSSGETFLAAALPQYAVISAGKDNRYGHPHKEVMDRFGQLNIPVFKTFEEGTIAFQSDGERVWRLR